MMFVEPPRVRKVVPSLVDLNNIEDADWRPIPRYELLWRALVRWLRA